MLLVTRRASKHGDQSTFRDCHRWTHHFLCANQPSSLVPPQFGQRHSSGGTWMAKRMLNMWQPKDIIMAEKKKSTSRSRSFKHLQAHCWVTICSCCGFECQLTYEKIWMSHVKRFKPKLPFAMPPTSPTSLSCGTVWLRDWSHVHVLGALHVSDVKQENNQSCTHKCWYPKMQDWYQSSFKEFQGWLSWLLCLHLTCSLELFGRSLKQRKSDSISVSN